MFMKTNIYFKEFKQEKLIIGLSSKIVYKMYDNLWQYNKTELNKIKRIILSFFKLYFT